MEPGKLIMRGMRLGIVILAAGLAASCEQQAEVPDDGYILEGEPVTVSMPERETTAVSDAESVDAAAAAEIGTPMQERVATLGLLNKRNNSSQDIQIAPGETQTYGDIRIRLSACERTAPWEMQRETGAFVQVDVQPRGSNSFERIFSGWLFKESPSLNVVEHPIYDVWVKDCAMSFPGEE